MAVNTPLNGTRTHPLTDAALDALAEIAFRHVIDLRRVPCPECGAPAPILLSPRYTSKASTHIAPTERKENHA